MRYFRMYKVIDRWTKIAILRATSLAKMVLGPIHKLQNTPIVILPSDLIIECGGQNFKLLLVGVNNKKTKNTENIITFL